MHNEPALRANLRKLRIVVVDDNRDANYTLAILLERTGFDVVARVCDAMKAIDCIKELAPHVALIDIAMPGLDGYEIARRLRKEMASPPALIALTGLCRAEDKGDAAEAGFDEHVMKPVDFAKLEELLTAYAAQGNRQRANC
jgi:CheY-like chemotaxis protein